MLPILPNKDKIKKAQTINFSGINRQPNAPDGAIWDTINMSSDRMPCLSPRKKRHKVATYTQCRGIFAYNGLYVIEGDRIRKDGEVIGNTTNTQKKLFMPTGWLIASNQIPNGHFVTLPHSVPQQGL